MGAKKDEELKKAMVALKEAEANWIAEIDSEEWMRKRQIFYKATANVKRLDPNFSEF